MTDQSIPTTDIDRNLTRSQRKITLDRDPGFGFGFRFKGGELDGEGIFVSFILIGGPADIDGRLHKGDQILSVNGIDLLGHDQATAVITGIPDRIVLTVQYRPEDFNQFETNTQGQQLTRRDYTSGSSTSGQSQQGSPQSPVISEPDNRADILEQLEEVFVCPVCLDTAKDPKILPCHHAFCLGCIQDVHDGALSKDPSNKDQLVCPMCKATAHLPGGSVHNLPADFRSNQVFSILEKLQLEKDKNIKVDADDRRSKCGLCTKSGKSVDANVLCIDCSKIFCNPCHELHKARFEGHLFGSFKTKNIARVLCGHAGSHYEYIYAFCLSCEEGICRDCMTTSHADHDVDEFARSDSAETMDDAYASLEMYDKRSELDKALSQILSDEQVENDNLDSFKAIIQSRKHHVVQELDKKEGQMLAKIDRARSEISTIVQNTTDQIFKAQEKLSELQHDYELMEMPVAGLLNLRLRRLQSFGSTMRQKMADVKYEMPTIPNHRFVPSRATDIDLGSVEKVTSEYHDHLDTLVGSNLQKLISNNEAATSYEVQRMDVHDKISISSCNPGDHVLFCLDAHGANFVMFTITKVVHFLRSDCFDAFGIVQESGQFKKTWVLAEVIEKEYCQTKKASNRYNLPVGSKFYRVRAAPWGRYDQPLSAASKPAASHASDTESIDT